METFQLISIFVFQTYPSYFTVAVEQANKRPYFFWNEFKNMVIFLLAAFADCKKGQKGKPKLPGTIFITVS